MMGEDMVLQGLMLLGLLAAYSVSENGLVDS